MYGLTKTFGTFISTDCYNSMETGSVGAPKEGVQIKLESWEEGGYTIFDEEGPKGEIHTGGDRVFIGYFEQPGKTIANFYEHDGKFWKETGDIGLDQSNGTFKISGIQGELINLKSGEHVNLSKVQSVLCALPLVHQCCAIGRSTENALFAIIVPNWWKLAELIQDIKTDITRYNLIKQGPNRYDFQVAVCKNKIAVRKVCKTLEEWCVKHKLDFSWIPRQYYIEPSKWTPKSGLVAKQSKIRRTEIEAHYKDLIDYMYEPIRRESLNIEKILLNNNLMQMPYYHAT